jgi:DNA-binding XRE family transcriptional regulator
MKSSKPTTNREAEILQAIDELHERLAIEKARSRTRGRLHDFLVNAGLTRADVLAVVANVFAKVPKGRPPGPAPKRAKGKLGPEPGPAIGKVGKAIRAARLAANLTTSGLGQKIGTGSGPISNYERGKTNPGPTIRARLARVLKVPADRFVNGDARP